MFQFTCRFIRIYIEFANIVPKSPDCTVSHSKTYRSSFRLGSYNGVVKILGGLYLI